MFVRIVFSGRWKCKRRADVRFSYRANSSFKDSATKTFDTSFIRWQPAGKAKANVLLDQSLVDFDCFVHTG